MPKQRHVDAAQTGSAFTYGLMQATTKEGDLENVAIGELVAELLRRVTKLEDKSTQGKEK